MSRFRILLLGLVLAVFPCRGQVRVATNIAHMLSFVPSQTQPWMEVLGYVKPGDWDEPRFYQWTPNAEEKDKRLPNQIKDDGVYKYVGQVDIRVFGANGEDDLEDTMPLQAAIDYVIDYPVVNQGVTNRPAIIVPRGTFRSRSLNITSRVTPSTHLNESLTIIGAGERSSIIVGIEDDYPVLDFIGRVRCIIKGIGVTTDPIGGARPSCGILIGRRADNENGGQHIFESVFVNGNFKEAGLWSVASEVNEFVRCTFLNYQNEDWMTAPFVGTKRWTNGMGSGVTSKFATMTGMGTGALNTANRFEKCAFQQNTSFTNQAGLYVEGALGWTFIDSYWYTPTPNCDQIRVGPGYDAISGRCQSMTFVNCRHESGSNRPLGIHYIGNPAYQHLHVDVTMIDCSFGPILGDDGVSIAGLKWDRSNFHSNIPGDEVLNVWRLYNSEIRPWSSAVNLPGQSGGGYKDILDGKYIVRNAGRNNRYVDIPDAQLFLADAGRYDYPENPRHKSPALFWADNMISIVGTNPSSTYAMRAPLANYSPGFPGTNAFTVSLLVSLPDTGDGNTRAIATLAPGSVDVNSFMVGMGGTNGAPSLWFRSYSGTASDYVEAVAPTILNDYGTEPHVLAFGLDRVNNLPSVWIDGLKLTNLTVKTWGSGGNFITANHPGGALNLGYSSSGINNLFTGSYGRATVFNYAFTDAQALVQAKQWMPRGDLWGAVGKNGAVCDLDFRNSGGGILMHDRSPYGNHASMSTNGLVSSVGNTARAWSGPSSQRDSVSNWANGDLWYNTDLATFQGYVNGNWASFVDEIAGITRITNAVIVRTGGTPLTVSADQAMLASFARTVGVTNTYALQVTGLGSQAGFEIRDSTLGIPLIMALSNDQASEGRLAIWSNPLGGYARLKHDTNSGIWYSGSMILGVTNIAGAAVPYLIGVTPATLPAPPPP